MYIQWTLHLKCPLSTRICQLWKYDLIPFNLHRSFCVLQKKINHACLNSSCERWPGRIPGWSLFSLNTAALSWSRTNGWCLERNLETWTNKVKSLEVIFSLVVESLNPWSVGIHRILSTHPKLKFVEVQVSSYTVKDLVYIIQSISKHGKVSEMV